MRNLAAAFVIVLAGCRSTESSHERGSSRSPAYFPYKPSGKLGSGGGGDVVIVHHDSDPDTEYAMKCGRPDRKREYLWELGVTRFFSRSATENFVRITDFAVDAEKRPCIVMERLGPDLNKILETDAKSLSVSFIRALALRMLEVLISLHRMGWSHGDAHPANWLTTKGSTAGQWDPSQIKLADFGWASPSSPESRRHDLRMIALTMRFALTGKYRFDYPLAYSQRPKDKKDLTLEELCQGVVPELCPILAGIYFLPKTTDVDSQYELIHDLLVQ